MPKKKKKSNEIKSKLSSKEIEGNKSDEQRSTIDNITKFYNLREEVIYCIYMMQNMGKDSKHKPQNKCFKN